MTIPAQHSRSWLGRRAPIVASLLALAMVVPTIALFVAHWRDMSADHSYTTRESHGVEYLMALSQLTVALTDAQSAAVSGQPISGDALTRAVDVTSQVDGRHGESLRVHDRWTQLRDTIGAINGAEFADPREAYGAHEDATDQLLDLISKIRETSGLTRDDDADTYYLQDSGGEELPETIVTAGQLVDLVTMTATGTAAVSSDEISVARVAVAAPVEDLAGDLQSAVESTASQTLSSTMLTKLDRFLRSEDALLAAVEPEGDLSSVDPLQLSVLRLELQAASIDLGSTLLVELEGLLETRLDEIGQRRLMAAVALVVTGLLAVAVVWVLLVGARRSLPAHSRDQFRSQEPVGAGPPSEVVRAELVEWERSGAR